MLFAFTDPWGHASVLWRCALFSFSPHLLPQLEWPRHRDVDQDISALELSRCWPMLLQIPLSELSGERDLSL